MAFSRRSRLQVCRVSAFGIAAVALTTLAGCAGSAKVGEPDPPEKLYGNADMLLTKGKYADAAEKFDEVDREHPYAPQARRAIVMAAYSYYKAGKYPEAVAAAKRYTTMHPGTKEAPMAQWVLASSYYDEIKDPQRDQGNTRKALLEFRTLVRRYPDNQYTKQAENRIRLCEDVLAASEMSVGRYYLNKRSYLAAINRFKTVVAEYQTTDHVEEALMRLTEGYMALGIRPEAQTATAILGHNYPNSKWYKQSYALLQSDGLAPREDTGSWLSQQMKKIIPGSAPKVASPAPAPSAVPAANGGAPAEPPPTPAWPPADAKPAGNSSTPISQAPTGRPMGIGASAQ